MDNTNNWGVTLIECLYSLSILSVIALAAPPIFNWRAEQQLQQTQAELRLLLSHARQSALQNNQRYTLCPLHQSGQCSLPWAGPLSLFNDSNGNRRLDTDEQIIQTMQPNPEIVIHWRGTLPNHSLHFSAAGLTHLSNGTFVLCRPQGQRHQLIVVNRQGRIRTSRAATPCPI